MDSFAKFYLGLIFIVLVFIALGFILKHLETVLFCIVLFLAAMIFTNPSRQDHLAAIKEYEDTESKKAAQALLSKDISPVISYLFTPKYLIHQEDLVYHKKLFYSFISYNDTEVVSVGLLGYVTVVVANNKEAKPETTEQTQPEPAAVPKPVTSQEPSNPPSTESGLLSTTSQLEDASGEKFQVILSEHGAVLESPRMKIYLGNDCAASSPQYCNGKWNWKEEFGSVDLDKVIFHFNYQKSPFGDSRCGE